MGKPVNPPSGGEIENINLKDALEERYLAYALSTIMHRALPDARDGLKPVHRRILHAMRLLRLDPRSAPKKCARIVGDVMGQFHPHGDQSIYDALVRMAQDFAQRYPLADGQGNFGNIDGDNAAAMRYTEAKLTEVARLLLEGIDEDSVDFRETYDQTNEEPVVLPAAFPNLLANGSQGIAVGMATSIPPHNAAELCDAALHLISKPERHLRAADAVRAGARSADRRHHRRHAVRHGRDLSHRPRLVPRARPLGQGGSRPRQLAHRRHRDPLCGAEVAPDREDRRAAAGEEAAAARRRARRIRRGHPRRSGAARARRSTRSS